MQVSRILNNIFYYHYFMIVQSSEDAVTDDAGKKTNEEPANKGERNGYANSTNKVSTISPSVSAAGQSFDNADDLPTNPLMPDLEDIADHLNNGIFSGAYNDEDEGAETDLNNLETTMNMDVKSAFLYGTIKEEVYVCQPPGFEDPQFPDKVYKVEKSLYGLHKLPIVCSVDTENSHEDPHSFHNKDIVVDNSVNFVDNNYHQSFDCSTVLAHRQAGTVVENHNHSENRSHITRTSMSRHGAVVVDHKIRVYYRKKKD
ncbi:putative ribonuclease H-like domain-containing protein [Tanacetum coccineum]